MIQFTSSHVPDKNVPRASWPIRLWVPPTSSVSLNMKVRKQNRDTQSQIPEHTCAGVSGGEESRSDLLTLHHSLLARTKLQPRTRLPDIGAQAAEEKWRRHTPHHSPEATLPCQEFRLKLARGASQPTWRRDLHRRVLPWFEHGHSWGARVCTGRDSGRKGSTHAR